MGNHASLDSKLKTIAIISSMLNGGAFIIRMGPGRRTRDSIIHKGDNLFSWTYKFLKFYFKGLLYFCPMTGPHSWGRFTYFH